MDTTRVSLLLRLKARDNSQAWQEFTAIYRPILLRYARACGLDAHDAEDIAQECLAQVNLSIERFEYDKRRGGFKRWLRVMVKREGHQPAPQAARVPG
jgi:DNA-directed RNA polymerase specialized sigma24 family protein